MEPYQPLNQNSIPPDTNNHRTIRIVLVIMGLVIVGAIVGAVWMFMKGDTSPVAPQQDAIQDTQVEEVVTPPEWYLTDKDGDGVSDEQEDEMGLNKFESDTDGDGLTDKVEIEKYGTDPTKLDTDGDGFDDGIEVINGYNPNGDGKL